MVCISLVYEPTEISQTVTLLDFLQVLQDFFQDTPCQEAFAFLFF